MAKNILAVIDCETTGLKAAAAEMLELCIYPITDTLVRDEKIPIFKVRLKAEHKEWISQKALEVNGLNPDEGYGQREAIEHFLAWKADNKIKKINAIGHYFHFDKSFLFMWLARCKFLYSDNFTPDFIDTKMMAKCTNHKCLAMGKEKRFPRLSLKVIAESLGIDYSNAHGAQGDCEITLAVMRAMLGI